MKYQEEEYTEKIERYLSGSMTDIERNEFEALIEKDELLQDEVEFQRGLTQFIQDEGASKIQGRVQKIRSTQENQSSFSWKTAIAAVFIFGLLTIPAYFFFSNKVADPVVLAEKYFEVYPDMLTQMGGDTDSMQLALGYYRDEKFNSAANIFSALNSDTTGYAKLYLSICQVETGRASEAVSTLQVNLKELDNENKLKSISQWYLILALLNDKQLEPAKAELKLFFEKEYRHNLDKAKALADDLGVDY